MKTQSKNFDHFKIMTENGTITSIYFSRFLFSRVTGYITTYVKNTFIWHERKHAIFKAH